MSDAAAIIRSNTKKKGLSNKRVDSLGRCSKCYKPVPLISSILRTRFPKVLAEIVGSYISRRDQYIGYNILHQPSRRCYHVVCNNCNEFMINSYLEQKPISNLTCPHIGCSEDVQFRQFRQNLLK